MRFNPPKIFQWIGSIPKARFVAVTVSALATVAITEIGKRNLKSEIAQKEVEKVELQLKLEEQKQINFQLQIELVQCQADYGFIRSSLDDLPLPAWITEAETNIVRYVNPKYETMFLKPLGYTKFDLIGKTANHIFGDELTRRFNLNNQWVIDNKRSLERKENVLMENQQLKLWNTVKYPIFEYERVRAVGGVAYL